MADTERDVSRIRQQIIENANHSTKLKEMEQRIDEKERRLNAKRARLKKEYELIKRHHRAHPVERADDGNLRVTIYIPRFLRTIILINWFVWFVVLPSILILWGDSPEHIVYIPVIVLLSGVWLLLTFAGWYLYWWLLAVSSTLGLVTFIILLYVGALQFNEIRDWLPFTSP